MRRGTGRTRHAVALSFLLIALICCPFSSALDPSLDVSQYAHTSWKVRDGFTKSAITSLAQTSDGYLWLGTEFGLYHFDGVRAVLWQPPTGQQLPSNNITALLASRDGTLWIGTLKGLASWKNTKLTTYPELSDQMVDALLEDRDGTVWVGGVSMLSSGKLCDIRNGTPQCHGDDGTLAHGVFGLFEDSNGTLWVGVTNGVWRWKPGSSDFFSVPGEQDGVRFGGEDEGGLIIAGQTGVHHFQGGRIQPFSVSNLAQPFVVSRMFHDRDGALWIGTRGRGLIHVHNGNIDVFSQSDTLTSSAVQCFLEDREGNVWVATADGLDRFRGYSVPTLSVKQGLSKSVPFSVLAARDGGLWIGTSNGLNKWERGKMLFLDVGGSSQKSGGKLSRFSPGSMFQDSEGRLWAANYYEFGYLEESRFVPATAVPYGYVHSLAELPAGHLWAANQQAGLFHLFRGKVVQLIPWAGLGHKNFVNVMVADPSQSGLWLGFFGGGVGYFADGGIREYYSSDNGLGGGLVNDLRLGPGGTLWVSTEGGLSRIKDGKVATLTSKNGLPCDSVLWTMQDDDHAFWLLMPCGLVRVTKSELDAWDADSSKVLNTTLFDNSDGVRTQSLLGGYTPHVAKSLDGRIWFTALDGVGVIDPHQLSVNKIPPPVHIEQITADDKTYDASNGLRLPAGVRNLTIDYTALSLTLPEKVHFRYKLEGQDKDWRETINERHLHYTNLSPNRYRFRVLASNNSGVWNEEGALLDFVIPAAWYQTNWFRALCVSVFLALVWMAYETRVRRLRHQFAIALDARVGERTRIARELHDTLLQSLHGLLLSFQRAANLLPDRPIEAKERLEGAIDQAAQAITEGRDAVQGLRSSTLITNELAEAIRALGEELAAKQTSQNPPLFGVVVEGMPRHLNPILRDDVYRIAGEALRNAFQHAEGRHIEVELHYDERRLRLRVRDDGKGVAPDVFQNKGRSGHWGLQGMRERAKLVGGHLEIWSELDSGTEIELNIPASAAYAKVPRHSRRRTAV